MFKNEFQGGLSLEILSVQGKEFASKCKILGTSINGGQREFDKSIKSNVLILEGESTRTKVVVPKDDKQTLCILQPFLIIQLFVAAGVSFSLEAVVLDSSNQKRRILMSTSYREISVTAFHVKVPLTMLKRGIWLNLCLDLPSFIAECFLGNSFKALENIIICANCRLRRIFSMRLQPKDDFPVDENEETKGYEEIPRSLQFANVSDVEHGTQVLSMSGLQSADIKLRLGSGLSRSTSQSDQQKTDKSQKTHIAFGSRVQIPKHASRSGSRGGAASTASLERQASTVSLGNSNGLNSSGTTVDLNGSSSAIMPQVEGQRPKLQPRPPKPGSGKAVRRPNPRIRSAESGRLVKRAKLKLESSQNEQDSRNSEIARTDMGKNETDSSESDKQMTGSSNEERNDGDVTFTDENNNVDISNKNNIENRKHRHEMHHVSQKLIGMKMGSQDDVEDYFRQRKDSESHDENSRSKDGSFSSTTGSEAFFLYSSRPRSIHHAPKSRRNSESQSKPANPPEVVIEDVDEDMESEKYVMTSLESDFLKESSDSETEDPILKMRKVNGSRRNSPRASPLLFDKPEESARIRSSLLKEISPPTQARYDHLKYQSINQSTHSDSMSWMYDSDSMQLMSHDHSDHSLDNSLSPVKSMNEKSPRTHQLKILGGMSESKELGNDNEDVLSDASDETSYSTWKAPPAHIRNYRYQAEMQGVGMTIDLCATLPITPFTEEQTSPIEEKTKQNCDSGISIQDTETMDTNLLNVETELDLLYDPILNCYYDPRTHKYYELAP